MRCASAKNTRIQSNWMLQNSKTPLQASPKQCRHALCPLEVGLRTCQVWKAAPRRALQPLKRLF